MSTVSLQGSRIRFAVPAVFPRCDVTRTWLRCIFGFGWQAHYRSFTSSRASWFPHASRTVFGSVMMIRSCVKKRNVFSSVLRKCHLLSKGIVGMSSFRRVVSVPGRRRRPVGVLLSVSRCSD